MKNILITFLYKEGAGPIFTLEMAKGLAANGYNVYVIVSNKISNRKDWERENSFKSLQFIETGTKRNAIQTTFNFFTKERFRIKNLYKDINFEFVISTFYHPWVPILLKCFSGKKIIICHDPIPHSGVKLLERILTKLYIKNADDIIVLTKSFIPIVEKRFKIPLERIHYMPHGRMSEYKKYNSLKIKPYNLKECSITTFLFFGRIEKYKGLHILSEAYRRLTLFHDNINLVIAGSGDFNEYQREFEKMSNVVIDNRYIPDTEIHTFFSRPKTILVLPYLDASQSGVIPVALEYGLPIIASDTGGLKEQLNNGQIGFFCKANDVDSLYKQMKAILNNPDIFKSEHEKSQSYLESLEWINVTKIFLNI